MEASRRRRGACAARVRPRESTLPILVASAIREAILAGRYREGARLVEQRVADALGVSRQPVREALRRLVREGLVTVKPRHGARVAVLPHEVACEIVEVACALERLDAKLAARRRDPTFAQRATALLAAGDAACAQARLDVLAGYAHCCSELIHAAAANHALADLLAEMRDRTHAAIGPAAGDPRECWRAQSAILRAVVAGDAELASLLALHRATRAGARFLAGRDPPCGACRRGFPPDRRASACPAVVLR